MTEVLSEEPPLFSVGLDVLDDRFDPIYYQPEYLEIEGVLDSLPHVQTLDEISTKIKTSAFYSSLVSDYQRKGIPFIRVSDIKDLTIDRANLIYLSEEISQKTKSIASLKSGDIVISKGGTLGNVAIIPREIPKCNISRDVIGVAIKEAYNPEYISVFLSSRFGLLQMERISQGQVQFHLTVSDIRNIKIPIPPRPVQDKIANIMQNAYEERKRYLQRADEFVIQHR